MIILPCAEFASDLPDDSIENEEGTDFLQLGGKGVTEAIAELLAGFGCTVGPVECADHLGWEVGFHWQGRRLWCLVTSIEDYILQTGDPAWLSRSFKKNKAIYGDALMRLASALNEDPRFHNVRWYSKEDLLGGGPGAMQPVIR